MKPQHLSRDYYLAPRDIQADRLVGNPTPCKLPPMFQNAYRAPSRILARKYSAP